MTSAASSDHTSIDLEKNKSFYYFAGKVRAFWKNIVFFSDAKNVALIEIQNVYLYGQRASFKDLPHLVESLEKSGWEEAPMLHSYVSEYPHEGPHPWPYQLSGKVLWKARYAWLGNTPSSMKTFLSGIYMPVSYYTGRIIRLYRDKILFGDSRNSVMVSSDNFYVNGKRSCKSEMFKEISEGRCHVMHAYVMRLDVLTDTRYRGPEPDLPTWPKENFSSDLWVAQFAWMGEMPEVVRDQIERYFIIRMNQWGDLRGVPWRKGSDSKGHTNHEKIMRESLSLKVKDEEKISEKPQFSKKLPVPVEQTAGIMRGSLLLADHKQGLMTSFADVIAFTKENFFINGEKFRANYSLSRYFQGRLVPITAWVLPLDKPKIIFDINVAWYAVCVWFGSQPRHLETIKKQNSDGKFSCSFIETNTALPLTHFMGNIKSLSYASGVLVSLAGLDKAVKIFFRRKVVHLNGYKFHSNWSLLDRQHKLENIIWSVLAYPVWTDEVSDVPQYRAVAMWDYNDQHLMTVLSRTITEFTEFCLTPEGSKHGRLQKCHEEKEESVHHLSGWIAKTTEEYGIIQSGSALGDATYLYFSRSVLYVNGELLPRKTSLQSVDKGSQCSMQANPITPKTVDGYQVTMEATMVWIGRKPLLESSSRELKPSSDLPRTTKHIETINRDFASAVKKPVQTETFVSPNNVLHTTEGLVDGDILLADNDHGLIICSNIVVGFSSEDFYINGERFRDRYSSLNKFCLDKKVSVQAFVVTLAEPHTLFNLWVMCEAVCVWTGKEPDDLKTLKSHHKGRMFKTSEESKRPSNKYFLYFMGQIIHISEGVTLLSSRTRMGRVNIILTEESLFVNGAEMHKVDIFKDNKKCMYHIWSVLAVPLPPKVIKGLEVTYTAVAIWDLNHHHKMRKELLLMSSQYSALNGKQEYSVDSKKGIASLEDSEEDRAETLFKKLQLEEYGNDKASLEHPLNDSSVIISHIAQKPSGNGNNNNNNSFLSLTDDSENNFCGKHITGYIMKKFKGGGLAQWKSIQFEGIVYIKFCQESLYLDLEPLNKKWKLDTISTRSCNFYVIPVPHEIVGEHTVSLKATCGWMGKKPSHIPAPGTQSLHKIDLSSVHVTRAPEVLPSESDVSTLETVAEVSSVSSQESSLQSPQPVAASGETQEDFIEEFEDGNEGNVTMLSQVSTPVLKEPQNTCGSHTEEIWNDELKKNHKRGTIAEVHSSVGQVKGVDGSLHYFSRDQCFLYGVSLRNVELWHVLAQDDPVLYTVIELVPGMMKVQKVWLGALEVPESSTAAAHILVWCRKKLVPDGARDILVHQLEMQ